MRAQHGGAWCGRVNTSPLHIVYVSRLALGRDDGVFSGSCRHARVHNLAHGITGVLLFDGERFLQWLYGAPGEVAPPMDRIAADARRTGVQVLLQAQWPAAESGSRWRSGYVDAEALEALAARHPAEPGALLDGLAGLIAEA